MGAQKKTPGWQAGVLGSAVYSGSFCPSDDDCANQCAVVLAALRQGPKTTTELRQLGVMSPACRVYDLRKTHTILTVRSGRQAAYVLEVAA